MQDVRVARFAGAECRYVFGFRTFTSDAVFLPDSRGKFGRQLSVFKHREGKNATEVEFISQLKKISHEDRKMSTKIFRQATFVLLTGAFILTAHVTGLGQNPKPSPSPVNVTVVNTPSQPVPVTGTVNVGNLGSSPLPVTGVLGVENAAGGSLLTRNLDGPTRQRVAHTFNDADPGYTVPQGKLLVIDYLSGLVITARTDPMPMIVADSLLSDNRFYYLAPNSWIDPVFSNQRYWVWGTQTQMFFPAGFDVSIHKFEGSVGNIYRFSYHGYLVDVP